MQISLNVYDVTNTASDNTNGMITRLNSITRDLNFGGVFHGAVQLDELEWSFGYCESGTGVYCCHARSNSLYTFREHIELGVTHKSRLEIKEILTRFKRTWPGTSYDLLQRNCCHFCEELCTALGVPSPPAWLNRFAQGADATVKFTSEASALAKRVGSNLSLTAQQSALWLRDMSQRMMSQISQSAASDSASGDERASEDRVGSPRYAGSQLGPHGLFEPPSTTHSEPAGMGRLASRLRQLGAGGTSAASSGLPASTSASSSDLASQPGPSQPLSQSLPSALRQKWQELEASAGDGTKQFLFGLIKTRQVRLDEDDPELCGSSHGGSVVEGAVASVQGGVAPGAVLAPAPTQAPTQAPEPQVISHTLLPVDLFGTGPAEPCAGDARVPASKAPAVVSPPATHLLDL